MSPPTAEDGDVQRRLRAAAQRITEEYDLRGVTRGYRPAHRVPVSTAWIWDYEFVGEQEVLRDAMGQGWDELLSMTAWADWWAEHAAALHPVEAFLYLQIDERRSRRFRSRDDGLSLFVPITELREAPDLIAALRDVLASFFERRARVLGLPAPPPSMPD